MTARTASAVQLLLSRIRFALPDLTIDAKLTDDDAIVFDTHRGKVLGYVQHDGYGKYHSTIYISWRHYLTLKHSRELIYFRSLRRFPKIAVDLHRTYTMEEACHKVFALFGKQCDLFDFRCPECGRAHTVEFAGQGGETTGDHEDDDETYCVCTACGRRGSLDVFDTH